MKDFRPALRSLLLGDPTVSGLVGGERIYPVKLPQGMKDPSVVYFKITEEGDYHMAGPSGLAQSRVQMDSWAQRNDVATELAGAVYDRISGFKGLQDTIEFRGIFLEAGREDYDATAELYRTSRDYIIWYLER